MKKFKNKIAVKGGKSLLKAFAEELKEIGYIPDKTSGEIDWTRNLDTLLTQMNYDKNGIYGYHNHNGEAKIILYLPKNWDKALELAAEVELEVPAYVKCIKTNGENDCTSGYPMDGGIWSFEPSTKEEYDKQSKIKLEVGKWYKLEDYTKDLFYVTSVSSQGISYGYGFINGFWKENLIDDRISCICNDVAFRRRAKLATDKEVEEVLVAEAKKRFPIGCKFINHYQEKYTLMNDYTTYKFVVSKDGDYRIHASSTHGSLFKNGKWAQLIKEEIKFKEGDWIYYKDKLNEYLVKFKSSDRNHLSTDEYYTVCLKSKSVSGPESSSFLHYTDEFRLATQEEIKRILVDFAKDKYPVGSKGVKCLRNWHLRDNYENIKVVHSFRLENLDHSYQLWVSMGYLSYCIYNDGSWAEIVNTKFTIKGYDVIKLDDYTVKVGCQEFKINDLNDLYCVLDTYNMTVHRDGKVWEAKEVKSILDYCSKV